MVSCAACGCSKTPKNISLNITFHTFPKCSQQKQFWIEFVGKPGWSPKGTSFLCSQHFKEDSFDRSSKLKLRLKPGALPSLHVDRLKFVRTFNPTHVRPAQQKTVCEDNLLPAPSTSKQADDAPPLVPVCPNETADSPRKLKLKRTIAQLGLDNVVNLNWFVALKSFEKICRICLEPSEALIPVDEIYFTRSCDGIEKEMSISNVFRKYCNLELNTTDVKPHRLCTPCTNKAYDAFNLFEQFVESNMILDDLIKDYQSDPLDLQDSIKIESDNEVFDNASEHEQGQAEFIMLVPEDKKINLHKMQNLISILNQQESCGNNEIEGPIEGELKNEMDCEDAVEPIATNGANPQPESPRDLTAAENILKWDHTYSAMLDKKKVTKRRSASQKSRKRTRPSASAKNSFKCNICEDTTLQGMDSVIQHLKDVHPSSKRCILCPKELQWLENVIVHVASHGNSGRLICRKCHLYFEDVKLLQQHRASQEHKAPFSCNICGKLFMRRYTLKLHNAEVHLKQGRFQCHICGLIQKRALSHAAHLETHASVPKTKKHLCEFCAKSFFRSDGLKVHVRRVHMKTKPNKFYRCEFCPKTFNSGGLFFNHRISHPECTVITCQYCHEVFSCAKDYRSHRNAVHSNFICGICRKGFPSKATLHSHQYIHNKLYSCSYCGIRFRMRGACQRHEAVHTNHRPFRCEYCDKHFRQQTHLNKHIESMHTEKSFKCTECNKGFVCEWSQRNHLRTHTGQKPFVCPYCDKHYRDTVGRHKHVKHDHPEKMEDFLLFKKMYQEEEVKVADS